jgi:small GTP-binding protein
MSGKPFKIILMGDCKVGKTSIINRHHNKSFDPDPIPTVGVSHVKETFSWRGREMERLIFDTAGLDIYASIPITYYRNADGAIAVFDVDNEDSFTGVEDSLNYVVRNWDKELNRPIVIAANKKDLRPSVDQEAIGKEWVKWAESRGVKLMFTSAKDGTNIEELFELVSNLAVEMREGTSGPTGVMDLTPTPAFTDDGGADNKVIRRSHHKHKCGC